MVFQTAHAVAAPHMLTTDLHQAGKHDIKYKCIAMTEGSEVVLTGAMCCHHLRTRSPAHVCMSGKTETGQSASNGLFCLPSKIVSAQVWYEV